MRYSACGSVSKSTLGGRACLRGHFNRETRCGRASSTVRLEADPRASADDGDELSRTRSSAIVRPAHPKVFLLPAPRSLSAASPGFRVHKQLQREKLPRIMDVLILSSRTSHGARGTGSSIIFRRTGRANRSGEARRKFKATRTMAPRQQNGGQLRRHEAPPFDPRQRLSQAPRPPENNKLPGTRAPREKCQLESEGAKLQRPFPSVGVRFRASYAYAAEWKKA